MSTTPAAIIKRAMRLIGQIGSGETPSTDEYTDGLEALNDLLEDWRLKRLLAYAYEEVTLTLANADSSYTIGTSGDVNTTRPIYIKDAWIVDSNTSYPVEVLQSEEEYTSIPDKTTTSDWPSKLLYRASVGSSEQGTIIVWPVPNATRTMKLLVPTPVTSFAATSTTIYLAPGWKRALTYNLAVELAPEFELEAPPAVQRIAAQSVGALKSANYKAIKASTGLEGLVGSYGHVNIESGA